MAETHFTVELDESIIDAMAEELTEEQWVSVSKMLHGLLKLEGGEVVVFKCSEDSLPPEHHQFITEMLTLLAGEPVYVLRLNPDEDVEVWSEIEFAKLARSLGYYKAEPDR